MSAALFLPAPIGSDATGARGEAPSGWTGRMFRVCLRCKQTFGAVLCVPEQDGKESHGFCAVCGPLEVARTKQILAMHNKPTGANRRAAIESRRVREELSSPRQIAIRTQAVREMEFGRHWIWRNGEEYLTAEGLRLLADAYDRERDEAAALVCRRLAGEIDAAELVGAQPPTPADEPDTFAQLGKRGLA